MANGIENAKAGRYIFSLSMPRNNSWNNKWSGAGNDYSVARKLTSAEAEKLEDSYSYNFGDGWVAQVSTRKAKPREKVSNKFCGYEWMVRSILSNGEIQA